jgi:heat-inducible transcriptional repressor
MGTDQLTPRERRVLEAVIHSFVETAEPAGSRTIARRFDLGVSAATIRNTMSDLEERGYLYHPHTSAGRIPTDRAYRVYVDALMAPEAPDQTVQAQLRRELGNRTAIESILDRAADVLGLLTQELGVAVAPSLDNAVLERLELIEISSERLLLVLVLRGGVARTLFIELATALPPEAVTSVALVLNERLAGLTLGEIRATLRTRLRDVPQQSGAERELLNVFIEEADQLLDAKGAGDVLLGSTKMLAGQPEFSSNDQMRRLLELTERRDLLRTALRERKVPGVSVTIGTENIDPQLSSLTIITSTYQYGPLSGTIGVIGPTRMPYHKVVAMVEHTSRLIGELLPDARARADYR